MASPVAQQAAAIPWFQPQPVHPAVTQQQQQQQRVNTQWFRGPANQQTFVDVQNQHNLERYRHERAEHSRPRKGVWKEVEWFSGHQNKTNGQSHQPASVRVQASQKNPVEQRATEKAAESARLVAEIGPKTIQACKDGDAQALRRYLGMDSHGALVEYRDEQSDTPPLVWAASSNNVQCVEVLIEHGSLLESKGGDFGRVKYPSDAELR